MPRRSATPSLPGGVMLRCTLPCSETIENLRLRSPDVKQIATAPIQDFVVTYGRIGKLVNPPPQLPVRWSSHPPPVLYGVHRAPRCDRTAGRDASLCGCPTSP